MTDVEDCFNFNFLEYRSLEGILNSKLTEMVCYYGDFDEVLRHIGNMGYDIELIA